MLKLWVQFNVNGMSWLAHQVGNRLSQVGDGRHRGSGSKRDACKDAGRRPPWLVLVELVSWLVYSAVLQDDKRFINQRWCPACVHDERTAGPAAGFPGAKPTLPERGLQACRRALIGANGTGWMAGWDAARVLAG